jgi:hypothetical protein
MADFCDHGYEPSGYLKGEKFHDQLKDYQLLNKDTSRI